MVINYGYVLVTITNLDTWRVGVTVDNGYFSGIIMDLNICGICTNQLSYNYGAGSGHKPVNYFNKRQAK